MQRYEGLTFARQGLQVAMLVIVPISLVALFIFFFILFPQLIAVDWLFILLTMLFIGSVGFVTLKAYMTWAIAPCTVVINEHQIVINIAHRSLFYPYRQKIITLANIRNVACSMDMRLGKSFINISTHKPKATYALQYLDERADDPNPEIWQNIQRLVSVYNENQGTEQITTVGFFEGWWIVLLMVITGGFFAAFTIAMLTDPQYRTWDRLPTYVTFGVTFFGLLASWWAAKKSKSSR